MDPRVEAAQAWAANTHFPNASLQARTVAHNTLSDIATANPQWFAIFTAGLLGDLGRTLPDTDNWRNASARLGQQTVGDNPPDTDGATLGTSDDFNDLAPPQPRHEWTDLVITLPSLGGDLTPAAAALVANATNRYGNPHAAAQHLTDTGDLTVDNVTAAATWLAHRRYQYGIGLDAFPIVAAIDWAQRAATEADTGTPWDDDPDEVASRDEDLLIYAVERQVRRLLASGALDDDPYDMPGDF